VKIKSGVEIEDPVEIHDRLSKNDRAGATLDEDAGAVRLTKAVSIRGSVPKVPDADEIKALAKGAGIPWHDDYADRAVGYIASDESVDGHGDIVRQNWKFDEFDGNPVMPFNHRWHDLPVGNAIKREVIDIKRKGYSGRALYLLGLFAREETYAFADEVLRLVKAGFMSSGSVGFYSTKVIDVKDEDERKKLGLGRWGVILDQNQLVEFSPTTIGANKGATALPKAMQSGLITADDAVVLRELYRREAGNDRDAWEQSDRIIRAACKTVWPKARFERHAELDVPIAGLDEIRLRHAPARHDDEIPVTRSEFDALQAQVAAVTTGHTERMDDLEGAVDAVQARLSVDAPEGGSGLESQLSRALNGEAQ